MTYMCIIIDDMKSSIYIGMSVTAMISTETFCCLEAENALQQIIGHMKLTVSRKQYVQYVV